MSDDKFPVGCRVRDDRDGDKGTVINFDAHPPDERWVQWGNCRSTGPVTREEVRHLTRIDAEVGGEPCGDPEPGDEDLPFAVQRNQPDTWPLAETWEDCARHIEAGGVVEVLDDDGVWRDSRGQWAGAPGTGGWKPQRLVPIPAPAPESSPDGEGERQVPGPPWHLALDVWLALGGTAGGFDEWAHREDERRTWPDAWSQICAAIEGNRMPGDTNPPPGSILDLPSYQWRRAARLDAWPEVPDGCEVLVVPEWVSDELAEWGEEGSDAETRTGNAARAAVDRRPKPEPRVERVPAMEAVEDRRMVDHPAGPFEAEAIMWIEGEMAVCEYGGWAAPIRPDGTVGVLAEDGES